MKTHKVSSGSRQAVRSQIAAPSCRKRKLHTATTAVLKWTQVSHVFKRIGKPVFLQMFSPFSFDWIYFYEVVLSLYNSFISFLLFSFLSLFFSYKDTKLSIFTLQHLTALHYLYLLSSAKCCCPVIQKRLIVYRFFFVHLFKWHNWRKTFTVVQKYFIYWKNI